jgi:hypothetical protein
MSKKAMKQALEALNVCEVDGYIPVRNTRDAIKALEEALKQEQDEPAHLQRCALCNYQHGHAIGCKNNPVDIALAKLAQPAPVQQEQGEKSPPEQWRECWYGSGSEKGWWIVCGRNRIAHLGVQVSSDEVSKVVDAHNRYKPTVQPKEQEQGEPFAWCIESKNSADWCFAKTKDGVISNAVLMDDDCNKTDPFPIYTTPQQLKPLTQDQIVSIRRRDVIQFARAIEAAHGIKE